VLTGCLGERCGERIWPMPCDEDFADDLKSDLADTLQCRQPTEGDHIYATSFLSRFMNPMVPWVHFDLASAYRYRWTVYLLFESFLTSTLL
jgi:leucyl aminopeptidase